MTSQPMVASSLPSDWFQAALQDVLVTLPSGGKVQQGWSPQCEKGPAGASEWGVLKTTSVQPGRFEDCHNKRLPSSLAPRPALEVQSGDLLLTNAGPRSRCAVPCLVRATRPRLLLSGKHYRFRTDEAIMDPRFLEYLLLAPNTQLHLDRMKTGISDSGLNLTRQRFLDLPVVVAPMTEQRRIVDVLEGQLSRLDAAEAALRTASMRLGSLERTTLSSAYRQGGLHDLGSIASMQGGIQKQPKRAPASNAYPFLRVANVTKHGLDLAEVHRVELFGSELERLRLEPGDLLVVEGNGSASQIGRAAVWTGAIENCVHQNHLIRVRPAPGLHPDFLEAVWNSPQHRAVLSEVASSTSGLHTLSVAKLKQLRIPLPAWDSQVATVEAVTALRTSRKRLDDQLAQASQRAAALRRSLLAAAFSGQL